MGHGSVAEVRLRTIMQGSANSKPNFNHLGNAFSAVPSVSEFDCLLDNVDEWQIIWW